MREPDYQREGVQLYLGDCLDILPQLGKVDAVVTDPPYGIEYAGSSTKHGIDKRVSYIDFDDTPEYISSVCVPAIKISCKLASRVVLTPGISNNRLYPQPDGEGIIWYPSGANRGPWGFVTHQPIYYYGKCPWISTGCRPTGFKSTEAAKENGHPCPKPIGQMIWLVNRGSLPGEIVCDPFMGSGTTGVACIRTGRKFIGIEIEPKYFDIAVKRIEAEFNRTPLWKDEECLPTQQTLIEE